MTPSLIKLKLEDTETAGDKSWIDWELTISYVTTLEGERFNKPAYAHYFRWNLTLRTDAQEYIPLTQSHPNVVLANALSTHLENDLQSQFGDRVMTPWFKSMSTRCMWQTILIDSDSKWTLAPSLTHTKLLDTNKRKLVHSKDDDSYDIMLHMNGVCTNDASKLKYRQWSTLVTDHT